MKPHRHLDHHDKLETGLARLFDATAGEPSGPTLTKLSARAADIPARVKRRPRWRSLLFWTPGMAAAVAALVLVMSPSPRHVRQSPTPATSTPPPALAVHTPRKSGAPPAAPAAAPKVEDPDIAELAAGFDDDDPTATTAIGLDPLYGPSQNDDLDAWLYAAHTVLQNGR